MLFLWELIEDWKDTEDQTERDKIFNTFTDMIWNCPESYGMSNNSIEYTVSNDFVNTDIGKVFYKYEHIRYPVIVRDGGSIRWEMLIRRKINSLYAYYFDKRVCETDRYKSLLNTPKRLYLKYRSDPDNFPYTAEELDKEIENALREAEQVRVRHLGKKIPISIEDWHSLCNCWMLKCFKNCMLIDDFDTRSEFYDADSEDNFYVSYICKSLEGYCKNYSVEYFGLKRQRKEYTLMWCVRCNKPFYQKIKTKRRIYCDDCQKEMDKIKKRNWYYRQQELKKERKGKRRIRSHGWDAIIVKEET